MLLTSQAEHSGGEVVVDSSGNAVADTGASITKTMNVLLYTTVKIPYRDVRMVEYLDTTEFTEKE